MELVGEEKKIQALFSELRLADEQAAPSFVRVWNRAQLRARARVSPLGFSLAAAAFAVFVAVVALALWLSSRPQTMQPQREIVAAPITPPVTPGSTTSDEQSRVPPTKELTKEQPRVSRNARAARFAARQKAELLAARRAEIRDATAISSWQSPTATLLSSQNDALLNSLPQLNDSVKDLKSFLPNK
jgi:hypothetical protein